MQSIPASIASKKFGQLGELAIKEPVEITKQSRPFFYAVSPEDFQVLMKAKNQDRHGSVQALFALRGTGRGVWGESATDIDSHVREGRHDDR